MSKLGVGDGRNSNRLPIAHAKRGRRTKSARGGGRKEPMATRNPDSSRISGETLASLGSCLFARRVSSPGGRASLAREFIPWGMPPPISSSARRAGARSVCPPGRNKQEKPTHQGLKSLATIMRPPGGEGPRVPGFLPRRRGRACPLFILQFREEPKPAGRRETCAGTPHPHCSRAVAQRTTCARSVTRTTYRTAYTST
jgi:hypothetical protein